MLRLCLGFCRAGTLFVLAMTAFTAFAAVTSVPTLQAQGMTTGAIGGLVTDIIGTPVDGVQIQVISRSTGYTTGGLSRANGQYFVPGGLEVGGELQTRLTSCVFSVP